jgi:hypothetical protein
MNARNSLRLTAIAAVLAAAGAVHAADMQLADEAPKTRAEVQQELMQWKAQGLHYDEKGSYLEPIDRASRDEQPGLTREQVREELAYARSNGLMAKEGDTALSDADIQRQQAAVMQEGEQAMARLQPAAVVEQWAALSAPAAAAEPVAEAAMPAADVNASAAPPDMNAAVPNEVPGSMASEPTAAGLPSSEGPAEAPAVPLPGSEPQSLPEAGASTGETISTPDAAVLSNVPAPHMQAAPEAGPMTHPALPSSTEAAQPQPAQ